MVNSRRGKPGKEENEGEVIRGEEEAKEEHRDKNKDEEDKEVRSTM